MWKTSSTLPALIGLVIVLKQSPAAEAAPTWEEAEQEVLAYSDALTEFPATERGMAASWSSFISGQYQQQSNWCGPAAVATALTNWSIPGVSQSTLASEMHTDMIGFTAPWYIDDALNRHWNSKFGTSDVVVYKTFNGISNDLLWSYAKDRISWYHDVLIILVFSHDIWYPSAPSLEGHYLVIYGYNDNWNGQGPTYLVWDPADPVDGAHHLSKNDWSRVAYFGNFVVAPTYRY